MNDSDVGEEEEEGSGSSAASSGANNLQHVINVRSLVLLEQFCYRYMPFEAAMSSLEGEICSICMYVCMYVCLYVCIFVYVLLRDAGLS